MTFSTKRLAAAAGLLAVMALVLLSFPGGNPANLLTGRNDRPEMVLLRALSSLTAHLPVSLATRLDPSAFEAYFDTGESTDHPEGWVAFRTMQLASDTTRNEVRPDGLIKANAARRAMLARAAASRAGGLSQTEWHWIGPGNEGGRIRAILVHPTDHNTIWIGSVGGGIWKTTDAGNSWAPVQDFMGNLAVTSLAMEPGNPLVLYAATGEGFYNGDAIRGAGIFKSTDGGVTWNQLAATSPANDPSFYWVNRLAINAAGVLLAATQGGVYRSVDGGLDWVQVSGPLGAAPWATVTDVKFATDAANRAIMAPGAVGGWLRYSSDGGVTWSNSNLKAGGRTEVAFGTGGTVYAVADEWGGTLYRSLNYGASWSVVNYTGHLVGQGWYDNALWVDPTNNNHIIAGGIDLWRSVTGGATFVKISDWTLGGQYGRAPHADHHAIVAVPGYNGVTEKRIYFGNDGGLYRADDISRVTSYGSNWTNLNNGLGITQFYSGAGHTGVNGQIVGGTQDNTHLAYAGGTSWQTYYGGDGGDSAIDPSDGNFTYGEYVYLELHRSTRRGWPAQDIINGLGDARKPGRALFIAPFAIDQENPNRMWAGGTTLWRTDSLKAAKPSWYAAYSAGALISAVADGTGDDVMYGTSDGTFFISGEQTEGAAALPGERALLAIKPDKSQPGRIFLGYGGYESDNLWRTTDGGQHWQNIHGNLPPTPVYSIEISPLDPATIYAGTEVGIFVSEDGGNNWSPVNDGPANVSVMRLFWLNQTTLVAATHGRGMFKAIIVPSFTLSYTRAGSGSGSVSFTPADIAGNCVQSCTSSYPAGTSVTLKANPAPGSIFAGWSGDCSGLAACSVTLSAARSVTATFAPAPGNVLSYTRSGPGSGTVSFTPAGSNASCADSCTSEFKPGTRVKVSQQAAPGSVFAGWAGACGGRGKACSVSMSAARSLTATFNLLPVYTLDYVKAGTGGGTVAFQPSGGSPSCSSNCTNSYVGGSVVTLTAAPDPGSTFTGWSGSCRGKKTACKLTMKAAATVTATFASAAASAAED